MANFALARNQVMQAVRVVRTTNLSGSYFNGATNNGVGATLTASSAAALTIDSVSVVAGDRVLLAAQTNANENGIYEVVNAGSASVVWQLKRVNDMQCAEQLGLGYFVPVYAGTANAGALYTVVEPLPEVFGVDDLVFESVQTPGGGSATFVNLTVTGVATIPNEGLHLLDTDASHDLIIKPGSNLTADRILTITTGDAARTLDISAASVTVSAFGATLVDDATNLAAMTTLGIKRGTTAAYGGGGTSNAFVATGIAATDIVVASILSSTNAVSLTTIVPTANTLTVGFSADPGANTVVNWIAIPTV